MQKVRPEKLSKTMNLSLLHSSQQHSLQVLLLHSREMGSCALPSSFPPPEHRIACASPDAVETSGKCPIPLCKVSPFTFRDIANVWSPVVFKYFKKSMRSGAYSLHLCNVKHTHDIDIFNIKEEFCKLCYYEV